VLLCMMSCCWNPELVHVWWWATTFLPLHTTASTAAANHSITGVLISTTNHSYSEL
jgi:hypothetical protein